MESMLRSLAQHSVIKHTLMSVMSLFKKENACVLNLH